QADDGIRDFHVTGVQTCALPIWSYSPKMSNGKYLALISAYLPLARIAAMAAFSFPASAVSPLRMAMAILSSLLTASPLTSQQSLPSSWSQPYWTPKSASTASSRPLARSAQASSCDG